MEIKSLILVDGQAITTRTSQKEVIRFPTLEKTPHFNESRHNPCSSGVVSNLFLLSLQNFWQRGPTCIGKLYPVDRSKWSVCPVQLLVRQLERILRLRPTGWWLNRKVHPCADQGWKQEVKHDQTIYRSSNCEVSHLRESISEQSKLDRNTEKKIYLQ